MTHHTEAERPCWRDRADEIEQQVGMGKMDAMACYTQMVQLLDAERRTPAVPVRQGWQAGQSITEEMHVAACKVLLRAHGLDGTPQRMLNAMLAAAKEIGATHGQ